MRKDVLPTYGGSAHTPNIDSIARDSVVYDRCIAPSPWTTPSHASLFTGDYPSEHGVHETREKKSPQLFGQMNDLKQEGVAETLRSLGYNTVGFSANPSVGPGSGFDVGFNSFTGAALTRRTKEENDAIARASKYGANRSEVASYLLGHGRFLELLRLSMISRQMTRSEKLRGYPLKKGAERISEGIVGSSFEQPFFLFVNMLEMHEPYTEGEPTQVSIMFGDRRLTESKLNEMKAKYLLEAEEIDTTLGSVLAFLRENGAYDESMIILTSDHGQALGEHSFFGHGTFLYDEIIEVPLMIKYPNNSKPPRGAGYQSLTDLRELVERQAAGEGVPEGMVGKDAVFSESYGIPQEISFFTKRKDERIDSLRDSLDVPRKAVYQGEFKLVVNGVNGRVEEFSRGHKPLDPARERNALDSLTEKLRAVSETDFVIETGRRL